MPPSDPTETLHAAADGDRAAAEKLLPLVYEQLRRLAADYLRHERTNHTLQPTALVHEAYARLIKQPRADLKGRTHFFAVAASMMRRILVDHARQHRAAKRGGGAPTVSLEHAGPAAEQVAVELLDVDAALVELERLNERQARVVELRVFGGMSVEEVAAALGVSARTVKGEWRFARTWLFNRLRPAG